MPPSPGRGSDLAEGLRALLERIGEEIDFNTAKGASAYRLGMHDALRFAEDAIVAVLRRSRVRGRGALPARRCVTGLKRSRGETVVSGGRWDASPHGGTPCSRRR